jgi:hypothetical protein
LLLSNWSWALHFGQVITNIAAPGFFDGTNSFHHQGVSPFNKNANLGIYQTEFAPAVANSVIFWMR